MFYKKQILERLVDLSNQFQRWQTAANLFYSGDNTKDYRLVRDYITKMPDHYFEHSAYTQSIALDQLVELEKIRQEFSQIIHDKAELIADAQNRRDKIKTGKVKEKIETDLPRDELRSAWGKFIQFYESKVDELLEIVNLVDATILRNKFHYEPILKLENTYDPKMVAIIANAYNTMKLIEPEDYQKAKMHHLVGKLKTLNDRTSKTLDQERERVYNKSHINELRSQDIFLKRKKEKLKQKSIVQQLEQHDGLKRK